MKKLFSILAVALFTLPIYAQDPDVVISGAEFAGQGTASTGSAVSATVDGVPILFDLHR